MPRLRTRLPRMARRPVREIRELLSLPTIKAKPVHQAGIPYKPRTRFPFLPEMGMVVSDHKLPREHSVILTFPAIAVDSAQTPDRVCRYIWHSAALTCDCCSPHTTR